MTVTTRNSGVEDLVLITPRLTIWSGTVKLERERDLIGIKDQLPPREIASDGSKYLVDRKVLKGPRAIRKRLERLIKNAGFSFMGDSVACSEAKAKEVLAEIPALEAEFNSDVDGIINNLHRHYDEQEDKVSQEWKEVLHKARLTKADVQKRFKFDVLVFKVAAPDASNPGSDLNQRFSGVVSEAVPKLLADIAADAKSVLETSFMDGSRVKGKLTQAQLKLVQRIVKKLDNYSFLDARVTPAVQAFNATMSALPRTGPLTISDGFTCVMLLKSLQDGEGILAQGEALLQAKMQGSQAQSALVDAPQGAIDLEQTTTTEAAQDHDSNESEDLAASVSSANQAKQAAKPAFVMTF